MGFPKNVEEYKAGIFMKTFGIFHFVLLICILANHAYGDCTSMPETPKGIKEIVDWEKDKINHSDPSEIGCVINTDGHKLIVNNKDDFSNPQPTYFNCSAFCDSVQKKTLTINLPGSPVNLYPQNDQAALSPTCHNRLFDLMQKMVPLDRQDPTTHRQERVCFNHVIMKPVVNLIKSLSDIGESCSQPNDSQILNSMQKSFEFTIDSGYGIAHLPDYVNIYNAISDLNKNHDNGIEYAKGDVIAAEGQLCYSPFYIESYLFGGPPKVSIEGMGLSYKAIPQNQ